MKHRYRQEDSKDITVIQTHKSGLGKGETQTGGGEGERVIERRIGAIFFRIDAD